MKHRTLSLILLTTSAWAIAADNIRQQATDLAKIVGLGSWLNAPVTIYQTDKGILTATDSGVYFFQYELETPTVSAEPNVVLGTEIHIPQTADKLVVVTHGWIDKAEKDWPQTMAEAFQVKTDKTEPNQWICGCFDWTGGSTVIASTQAAQYARDIAGPRLAAAILKLPNSIRHIHLVGHSAGSWVINSAAGKIARARPDITFHLTFLDAYVPSDWKGSDLAALGSDPNHPVKVWAEHYYTRDITYTVTQEDLLHAHNVDITAIDPLVAEHEFPYRWYLATLTGHYSRWDEKEQIVYTVCNTTMYGFARSLEAGQAAWQESRQLPCGNKAVIMTKSKK